VLKTDHRFKNKDGPPKRDPCRPGP
jgi:hypothetical protein